VAAAVAHRDRGLAPQFVVGVAGDDAETAEIGRQYVARGPTDSTSAGCRHFQAPHIKGTQILSIFGESIVGLLSRVDDAYSVTTTHA
jgi:hypothetical protein